MIEANAGRMFERLSARLTLRAQLIGKAAAENRKRQARGDANRWRDARLLWPLKHKD